MALIYSLADMRELQGFTRGVALEEERNRLMLSAFLPNTSTPDGGLDFKITTGALQMPAAAPLRSFDAEAPIAKREGLSKIMGELSPISLKIPVTEEMALRRRMLETGSNAALVSQVFDDTRNLARAIAQRIELMRGEALVTGGLAINENGVVQTVDFDRDASMEVLASTDWSTVASADPLTDELNWVQAYVDLNGVAPAYALTSTKAVGYLLQNAQYRELASVGGTIPSILTREALNTLRAQFGLPQLMTYDTKLRNTSGSLVRVIAEDKMLFLPPSSEPLGATFYGMTAEAMLLQGANQIGADETVGLTTVLDETTDPVATWVKVSGVTFPALINPNLCLRADLGAF